MKVFRTEHHHITKQKVSSNKPATTAVAGGADDNQSTVSNDTESADDQPKTRTVVYGAVDNYQTAEVAVTTRLLIILITSNPSGNKNVLGNPTDSHQ